MRGKPEGKSDRALELREKGLTVSQIAERLGTTPKNAGNLINAAKNRRRFLLPREPGKPPVDPDAEQLARDVLDCARAR